MARIHIVLGTIQPGSSAGVTIIPSSHIEAAETIASSGASQATTITAPVVVPPDRVGRHFWSVTAEGPVWLAFGPEPVAEVGKGWLVLAGDRLEFAAIGGDKAAVIDA